MHYTRWRAGVRLLQQGFRATSLAEYQQHVALNATAQSTLCQRAWLHSTVTALDSTKDDASRGKNDKPTDTTRKPVMDMSGEMPLIQIHDDIVRENQRTLRRMIRESQAAGDASKATSLFIEEADEEDSSSAKPKDKLPRTALRGRARPVVESLDGEVDESGTIDLGDVLTTEELLEAAGGPEAYLDRHNEEMLKDARVVRVDTDENGQPVEIDLGPARPRDVRVYGHPGYTDDDGHAMLNAREDLAEFGDAHPFGGSVLPLPASNPTLLEHPLDLTSLGEDLTTYLARRSVIIDLTHDLDNEGEHEIADQLTEELKDRDFEIAGRLLMQDRANEAGLFMEAIMAGQVDDEPGSFAQAMAYNEFKELELERRKKARLQAQSEKKVFVRQVDQYGRAYAVGRRKSAVAFVSVWPGEGKISINKQPLRSYFSSITRRDEVIRPLVVCNMLFDVDVQARVSGGGMMGQAQAIRHGIALALQRYNPGLRETLRSWDLVRRDSRVVERKKPGRAKARKAFQWVKR